MMPNGCLGSPVLVLLFGLDRGFLMDVGPTRATLGLSVHPATGVHIESRRGYDKTNNYHLTNQTLGV
jgi:hypothetical protein